MAQRGSGTVIGGDYKTMAHIDLSQVSYLLGDGRVLLDQVSFHIGDGSKTALIGPNGGGKTTLLRLISGDLTPDEGTIGIGGELAVMHQSIGRVSAGQSIRQLLASASAPDVRTAAERLLVSETEMTRQPSETSQLAYAQSLADWNDVGGYLEEALWNECCMAALGEPFEAVEHRSAGTLSGESRSVSYWRPFCVGRRRFCYWTNRTTFSTFPPSVGSKTGCWRPRRRS